MRYTYDEDFGQYQGVITNLHGFLHRYLDTGFKSKWSGYWVPPKKILDYFAFRINGTWLGPETLIKTTYGEEMRFVHDLEGLSVVETIKAPENVPGFIASLEIDNTAEQQVDVAVDLEIALDIRDKSTDIGSGPYQLTERQGQVIASRNGQTVMVETEPAFKSRGEPERRQHSPGEKQEAYIPGMIRISDSIRAGGAGTVSMTVTTSGPRFGKIESHNQGLDGTRFDGLLQESIESLHNLVYDRNGRGIIAGHPWFQEYWARDAFWSLMGIIDAGNFDLATAILETFVDHALDGKVPLDPSAQSDGLPRADTLPLFIIAADKLERHDGIPDRLKDAQRDAMASLSLDGGIVSHEPGGTWMDTMERPGAVEIQSLWLQAAKIMRDSRVDSLQEGLDQFIEEKVIADTAEGSIGVTANAAVPLFFGQVEEATGKKCLETLNDELLSDYGARTLGKTAERYEPDGYHTGAVWGLTTGWLAGANIRYGNEETGLQLIERFDQFRSEGQPGAFPEVVDAETGELLGCPEQAWSAGLMVNLIDAYVLGVTVDGDVSVDPVDGFSGSRYEKRLGNEFMDIDVADGEATIR